MTSRTAKDEIGISVMCSIKIKQIEEFYNFHKNSNNTFANITKLGVTASLLGIAIIIEGNLHNHACTDSTYVTFTSRFCFVLNKRKMANTFA